MAGSPDVGPVDGLTSAWRPRSMRSTGAPRAATARRICSFTAVLVARNAAHVVELACPRRQTGFDVAQAFAIGKLCKGHYAKVFRTRQRLHSMICAVAIGKTLKGGPWQKTMTCANRVLPLYIGGFHESARESLTETRLCVRVDTTSKAQYSFMKSVTGEQIPLA